MAYEMYQSRFTGAKIDEYLGDVPDLIEDVSKLKKDPITKTEVGTMISEATPKTDDVSIKVNADGKLEVIPQDLSTYATKSDLETLMGEDVDATLDTIKELGDAIKSNKDLIDGIHTHDNKDTLDKLSTNEDGNLLFDGNEIKGETITQDVGTVFRKETLLCDWTDATLNKVFVEDVSILDQYEELLIYTNWRIGESYRETININVALLKNDTTTRGIQFSPVEGIYCYLKIVNNRLVMSNTEGLGSNAFKLKIIGINYTDTYEQDQVIYRHEKSLWTGRVSSAQTLELSESYSNFDEIRIRYEADAKYEDKHSEYKIYSGKDIIESSTRQFAIYLYGSRYVNFHFEDNSLIIDDIGGDVNPTITEITGISYTSVETLPNRPTLEKLSTSEDGNLLFDGNEIKGGGDIVNATNVTSKVLFNSDTLEGAINAVGEFELADSVDNYDYVIVEHGYSAFEKAFTQSETLTKPYIKDGGSESNCYLTCHANSSTNSYLRYYFNSDGKKLVISVSYGGGEPIYRIIGYKLTSDVDFCLSYEDYSEEEKVIGKWIDGKPIYRKTFKGTATTTDSSSIISVATIENWENTCNAYGFISNIPWSGYPEYSNNLRYIDISLTNGVLKVGQRVASSSTTFDYIAIVEYTKTTDEPDSFNPAAMAGTVKVAGVGYENYSEDEIVIGKWIDGKPVYRKSFTFTSPSSGAISTLTNFEKLINCGVSLKDRNNNIHFHPRNDSSSYNTAFYIKSSGEIMWSASGYVNIPGQAWFDYTKTTDSPNSFTPDMVLGNLATIGGGSGDPALSEEELSEAISTDAAAIWS